MIPRHVMSPWFHLFIYSRRFNWNCPCQLFAWHCSPWYLLRSSTFSLRIIYRSRICYYRGFHSLIPPILRIYNKWNLIKSSLSNYVCRSQYNILPSTFSRPVWYTSALFRLSRCLYNMKHYFIHRVLYFTNSSCNNGFHSMRSICIKTGSNSCRINLNKPWMASRLSPSLPYIWRTNIY